MDWLNTNIPAWRDILLLLGVASTTVIAVVQFAKKIFARRKKRSDDELAKLQALYESSEVLLQSATTQGKRMDLFMLRQTQLSHVRFISQTEEARLSVSVMGFLMFGFFLCFNYGQFFATSVSPSFVSRLLFTGTVGLALGLAVTIVRKRLWLDQSNSHTNALSAGFYEEMRKVVEKTIIGQSK